MAHLAQTRDVHNSIVVDLQIQSIPLGLCRSMDKVLWGLSSLPAIAPLASEGGSEANGATNMFSTPGNSTRSPYTRCSAFIMILDKERGVSFPATRGSSPQRETCLVLLVRLPNHERDIYAPPRLFQSRLNECRIRYP